MAHGKFTIGDLVEFIDKTTTGKFPHTNRYRIIYCCKMKNPVTREWEEAYTYMKTDKNGTTDGDKFVRECKDMDSKFKKINNKQQTI